MGAVHRTETFEEDRRWEGGQPLLGQLGPADHPAYVGDPMAGRDHVAVEDAREEGVDLAVLDADHRRVEQRQPVDHVAGLDQCPAFALQTEGQQAGVAVPAADLLPPTRCVERRGWPTGQEIPLEFREQHQVSVHRALREPRRQATGATQPAPGLFLLATGEVADPQREGSHRCLGQSRLGLEGIAHSSTEPQLVVDATHPPHGVGVGSEVVGGEVFGVDSVEVRDSGGPVARGVGPLRECQGVAVVRSDHAECRSGWSLRSMRAGRAGS